MSGTDSDTQNSNNLYANNNANNNNANISMSAMQSNTPTTSMITDTSEIDKAGMETFNAAQKPEKDDSDELKNDLKKVAKVAAVALLL